MSCVPETPKQPRNAGLARRLQMQPAMRDWCWQRGKNKHELMMAKEKNKHVLQLVAAKQQLCKAMNKTHVGLAEVQSKSSKHFYNLQLKAGAVVRCPRASN
jgi:hypothetical protein